MIYPTHSDGPFSRVLFALTCDGLKTFTYRYQRECPAHTMLFTTLTHETPLVDTSCLYIKT